MPAEKIKQLEELVSSVLQSLDIFIPKTGNLSSEYKYLKKKKRHHLKKMTGRRIR